MPDEIHCSILKYNTVICSDEIYCSILQNDTSLSSDKNNCSILKHDTAPYPDEMHWNIYLQFNLLGTRLIAYTMYLACLFSLFAISLTINHIFLHLLCSLSNVLSLLKLSTYSALLCSAFLKLIICV